MVGYRRSTLLRRLFAANSLDLMYVFPFSLPFVADTYIDPRFSLDFVLTFVSVTFNYAGPFFLKCVFLSFYVPSRYYKSNPLPLL
jgi:hypothetical protein